MSSPIPCNPCHLHVATVRYGLPGGSPPMRWPLTALRVWAVATVGCSRDPSTKKGAAPAQPKLGIRANGDTEIQPDLTQRSESEDLFAYIDEHIDDHVVRLHKWVSPDQHSTSASISESAETAKNSSRSWAARKRASTTSASTKAHRATRSCTRVVTRARRGRLPIRPQYRHDAGHPARRVEGAAVRGAHRRAGACTRKC